MRSGSTLDGEPGVLRDRSASSTGPSSWSTNAWSSVDLASVAGVALTIAGPPVENVNGPPATGAPPSAAGRAQRERAGHAAGQSRAEVVDPRPRVDPSPRAGLGTRDVERRGGARIAERHHRRENRALAWRTCFTVPCGTNCSTAPRRCAAAGQPPSSGQQTRRTPRALGARTQKTGRIAFKPLLGRGHERVLRALVRRPRR